MIWLPKRATQAQRGFWKLVENKIDWISRFNRRRNNEYRGQAKYDARGWLEDNRELYTFDGCRILFADGSWTYPISGGVFSSPIGIPDPNFGTDTPIMPTLPSPWTSNVANFFYVRQGASGSGNGNPTAPIGTVPSTIGPGQVVVLDNTVTYTQNFRVTFTGTSANPGFLVGSSLSKTNRPVWNVTTDSWIDGTWGVIEFIDFFFNFSDGCFWGQNVNSNHLAFRHNIWRGNGSGTVSHASMQWASNVAGSSRDTVVIYDCTFQNLGLVNPGSDIDAHALKVDSNTANGWILDSTFTNIGGDSVQLGPQNTTTDWTNHHCYMGRCTTNKTRQSAGWVKHARDIVFSQNTIFNQAGDRMDTNPPPTTPGSGLGLQEGADRVWMLYNHIYDFAPSGAATGGQSGIQILQNLNAVVEGIELYAIGNVIHDIVTSGGLGVHGQPAVTDAIYIFNNTIFSVPFGIYHRNNNPRHVVWNNIVDNCSSAPLLFDGGIVASGSSWRNNLLSPDTSTIANNFEGSNRTFAQFVTQAGSRASGNINVNPTYVDSTNANHALRNFALTVGSNGIDAGRDPNPADTSRQNPYARFSSLYGLSISVDFDSVARPQGSWDIGAFEFTSGSDVTPPTIDIVNPTGTSYITNQNPLTILSGTSSDDVAVTSVTWTNDRGGSGTATGTTAWTVPSITLQAGANVLTVTAHDAAGNTASDSVTVTLDQVAPAIAITDPTAGPSIVVTSSPLPTLGGTASDASGIVSVSWSNDRGGSGIATGTTAWSVTNISLQPGSNVLTATALDAAGNTASDILTVTYTPSQAPPPARPFLS